MIDVEHTPSVLAERRFDWIEHHATRTPDRTAIIDLASRARTSYRELDERIDGWCARLAQIGVSIGDRVAVLAANCPEILEVQLACARYGAVFLPLNWRLAPEELVYIVGDADPAVVLAGAEFVEVARGVVDGRAHAAVLSVEELSATLPPAAEAPVPHDGDLGDVSSIMYTSGTTGRPKGALITHRMTLWHAINISPEAKVAKSSVHLAVLPLFHTGGLNLYVNPVLHAGGTVVLARAFDADQVLQALDDPALGITHLFAVPTIYQTLADHPGFAACDLSRLVMTGVGGAACPLPLLERWAERGRPLAQGWGMTEGGPSGTVVDVDDPSTPFGSVGKPLLHVGVRIADGEGRELVTGEVGELLVRGPSITPGYWRNDDATRSAFVDGWFRTGDAARVDAAGNVFIVDRWKDMYISGGENVYPAEVELVLAEHAGITSVAVVGVPDQKWGEVGRAFVVVTPGAEVSEESMRDHCSSRLARFKVPRSFVIVPELPMTASGKVMKRNLPADQPSS